MKKAILFFAFMALMAGMLSCTTTKYAGCHADLNNYHSAKKFNR